MVVLRSVDGAIVADAKTGRKELLSGPHRAVPLWTGRASGGLSPESQQLLPPPVRANQKPRPCAATCQNFVLQPRIPKSFLFMLAANSTIGLRFAITTRQCLHCRRLLLARLRSLPPPRRRQRRRGERPCDDNQLSNLLRLLDLLTADLRSSMFLPLSIDAYRQAGQEHMHNRQLTTGYG